MLPLASFTPVSSVVATQQSQAMVKLPKKICLYSLFLLVGVVVFCLVLSPISHRLSVVIAFSLAVNSAPPSPGWNNEVRERNEIEMNAPEKLQCM